MNLVPRGAAADDKESIALRPSFLLWHRHSWLCSFFSVLPQRTLRSPRALRYIFSDSVIPTGGPRRLRAGARFLRPACFTGTEEPWQDLNVSPTFEILTSPLSSAKLLECLLLKRHLPSL